jgi:outer membrane protein assembly factor BamC
MKSSGLFAILARVLCAAALAGLALAGCETMPSLGKKIDYHSVGGAPALELPPELVAPQYDDRYNVATASGLAARDATKPKADQVAVNATPDARIAKSGNERWLVVKSTPEEVWKVTRQFWLDNGFTLAVEKPDTGVMETDWAENRADIPPDFIRSTIGKYFDAFYNTYKREKYTTRIERGNETGTVEVFISARIMEQVPTETDKSGGKSGFAWGLMPPNPGLEAQFLGRLMMRFGVPESQATQMATGSAPPAPDRARLEKSAAGSSQLVLDDSFDRAWRRVGLALDRIGFTVVDRDRSKGLYFVRYQNPDIDPKKEEGFLSKLMFWKDTTEKPEQYRIIVAEATSKSLVSVQDPNGAPDKSQNGEKILTLLQGQLK